MDISRKRISVDRLALSKLVGTTLLFCIAVLAGCTSSQLAVPASAGLQSGEIAVETEASGELAQVAMVVNPAEPVAQPQVQPELQPKPESKPLYSQEDVVWIQQRLQDLGYYNGDIDGSVGSATRTAIEEYQQEQGVQTDGQPTAKLREYMWRNGG